MDCTAIGQAAGRKHVHEQGTRGVRAKTREAADIGERVNGGRADGLSGPHLSFVEPAFRIVNQKRLRYLPPPWAAASNGGGGGASKASCSVWCTSQMRSK